MQHLCLSIISCRITEFLIFHLEQSPYLAIRGRLNAQANNPSMLDKNCTLRDNEKCLYYLQKILNLATHSPVNFGASLTDKVRSVDRAKSQQIADHDPSGQVTIAVEDQEQAMTTQIYLTDKCLSILEEHRLEEGKSCHRVSVLCQTSVALLQQIFHRPSSATTLAMNLDQSLIQTLSWSIEQSDHMLQLSLMDLLMTVLGTQMTRNDAIPTPQRRPTSRETIRSASQLSLSTEKSDKDHVPAGQSTPTPDLLDCLMSGISSTSNHPILEHWIRFLDNCLPFYANYVFQILIPLIDCFKRSIELVFQGLRNLFEDTPSGLSSLSEPITILNTLCNGLEHVLTRGHDQLVQDESLTASLKSPEQIQGFFGNMVSGVFASEAQKSRSITANNRLTVLLCFKDAVRVSFTMWSWGNAGPANSPRDATHSASFNYTSLRLRNRTRRTLEQLFAAEALECLETLVEFWHKADSANIIGRSASVFNLMHALDGARPKNTIPALFNAIYSRTNPSVLDSVRKSSLTSELSDVSLATFLVAYTRSMEDDALDEIWAYCMTFLKDVLGNPMPHRQILPLLLEFTAVLGEKIDNTNFGEQRKMRRDIGVSCPGMILGLFG